jgi:hypothetical protein
MSCLWVTARRLVWEAGPGSNETNCKNNCFVSFLLPLVANSSNSSWFGDASGGQASFATYDARIGSEGSWQLSEDPEGFNFSVRVLGGPALVVPSGGGTSNRRPKAR